MLRLRGNVYNKTEKKGKAGLHPNQSIEKFLRRNSHFFNSFNLENIFWPMRNGEMF